VVLHRHERGEATLLRHELRLGCQAYIDDAPMYRTLPDLQLDTQVDG
jgi:hypothetical protein